MGKDDSNEVNKDEKCWSRRRWWEIRRVRPGLQTQEEICPSLVGRPFFLHRKWIAKRREVRGTKRKRETWKRVWLESMGFLINRSLQLTLCLCSLVYHVSRPSADLPFCCLFKIPNANLSGKQMMSAEWRNGCQKQCEKSERYDRAAGIKAAPTLLLEENHVNKFIHSGAGVL